MAEESGVFMMDSGLFHDIIPTLLSYLDLKSLVHLAQTCHFWKQRIYTDLKLWPKVVELPYIGRMDSGNSERYDPEIVVNAKLWSMVLPPEDPQALEKILEKMASSPESTQRFQLVKKVLFKNFIHTDESLRLTAQLFPSIEEISFEGNLLTTVGVQYIATSCKQLKHIEFYKCAELDISNASRLFNTEEHKQNLERIFLYNDYHVRYKDKSTFAVDLPFMALCQRCGLYFNELINETKTLCLYHPGNYSGCGHSCSSYNCCGSNTPDYSSTLGCEYTYHEKYSDASSFNTRRRVYEMHDGHPEYMFQKFNYNLFPSDMCFTKRRRLDRCYEKWNNKQTTNSTI